MENPPRLLVVDGSNIFFRAYFGLINQDFDRPTWGIHGFLNSLAGYARRFRPTHMVIVFDQGRSAYRMELYPEYKANRPKSEEFDPSDSADTQLLATATLLKLFGLRVWTESHVEGDDIIAAVVGRFKGQMDILVISGDKDLRQLIAPRVTVYQPSLKSQDREPWEVQDVVEHYGVRPERLPEVWALCGDKGDNIPGIPQIGEKRALKLIEKYGDLFKVGLSDDPKIENHRHQIYTNFKLVSLQPQLSEFQLGLDDVVFNPTTPLDDNAHLLLAKLQEYDLNKIITDWSGMTLWAERGKRARDFHKG